jgi:L-ascorbate metabolism protein UlaG (beta-lactamase superfamily)
MSTKFTWFGHATLGLEIDGVKVIVDPYFSENPTCEESAVDVEADYILLSHGHFDHIGEAIDIAKRTGSLVITNLEICDYLRTRGAKTHAQQPGGGFHHPFGYVKFTPAFHSSGLPDGSYGGTAVGFLITTARGEKIYLACDTGLFGDMRLIGEEGIDLAVLPIGDNFTMGPEDALRAVKLIQPKRVIPVHYGTWDMIAQDPQAWADRVRSETSTEVHILNPGDSFTL